jgi:hypothetical protein
MMGAITDIDSGQEVCCKCAAPATLVHTSWKQVALPYCRECWLEYRLPILADLYTEIEKKEELYGPDVSWRGQWIKWGFSPAIAERDPCVGSADAGGEAGEE